MKDHETLIVKNAKEKRSQLIEEVHELEDKLLRKQLLEMPIWERLFVWAVIAGLTVAIFVVPIYFLILFIAPRV